MIHLRIPYFRPSWHGGDVEHPLCLVPITGWAGERASAREMSEDINRVSCPDCRALNAAGGIKARYAELLAGFERLSLDSADQPKERRAA